MNLFKTALLCLMISALAACASKEPMQDTPAPQDDDRGTTAVETTPTDPFANVAANDPRQLNNPNSPLATRVIYFDYDSSNIRSEFRGVLAAHARFLGANSDYDMTLEGHADERGSREYNLGLGERRGNAVEGVLTAGGAGGGQVDVVSYGEERPASTCAQERCWSQNRRVEIVYERP